MMKHLSPEEFVDVLEGAAPSRAADHLASCEACRGELEEMRAVMTAAAGLAAQEPSPLFWDHFSARVKDATSRESAGGWSWRAVHWKPVFAVATLVVAIALGVVVRNGLVPDPAQPSATSAVTEVAPLPPMDDDGSWSLMTALASDMDWEEVNLAVAGGDGSADALIEELTPSQREALARLLQKEIGDL